MAEADGSLSRRALPPVHAAEPIVSGKRRVQAALPVYSSRLASSDRGRRLRSGAFPRSRRPILDCHVDKRCESLDGADRRLRCGGRYRRRSALRLAQPHIRLRACLRRLHRVVRGEDFSHAFVGGGRASIRIGDGARASTPRTPAGARPVSRWARRRARRKGSAPRGYSIASCAGSKKGPRSSASSSASSASSSVRNRS